MNTPKRINWNIILIMGFTSILISSFLSILGGIALSIFSGFFAGRWFAKDPHNTGNPMPTALVNANWMGLFIALGQLIGLLFIALTPQFTTSMAQYGLSLTKGELIAAILFLGAITGAIEYGLTVGTAALTTNFLKPKNKPMYQNQPIYFSNTPAQFSPQPPQAPSAPQPQEPLQYPPPPEFYAPTKQETENLQ